MTSTKPSSGNDELIPSLSQFQGEHDRMIALFQAYQCGLMALDLGAARCGLEGLRYELEVHMQVEDTVLMPIFQGLESHPEGGAPVFFEKEHAKLKSLLEGLFAYLQVLESLQANGKLGRPDALVLIEQGFTFKHLFEHHTSREDKAFYPTISESLDSTELKAIWKRMDAVEAGARASLGKPPGMESLLDPE